MKAAPCNCNAYPFPHRPMGGKCDGEAARQEVWDKGDVCRECEYYHEERDPYGTGDRWYVIYECQGEAECCPGLE